MNKKLLRSMGFKPKDNSEYAVSWVGSVDFFDDVTLKEKYECVYTRLVKVIKELLLRTNYSESDPCINTGNDIADMLDCSRTYCFSSPESNLVREVVLNEDGSCDY